MTRWLFWVAVEWAIILAALWAASWSLWLLPLAMLVIGSRQHALGVLGHEAVHRAAGVSDRVANMLTMWPLGASVAGYRLFHLQHHVFLGRENDPELEMKAQFADRWRDLSRGRKATLLARDIIGLHADEPLAFLRRIRGTIKPWRVVHAVAFVALLVLVGDWIGPLIWISALLTSFWACARARAWCEHYGGGQTYVYAPAWWERAIYLPHHVWKHAAHHESGRWNVPAWDLR